MAATANVYVKYIPINLHITEINDLIYCVNHLLLHNPQFSINGRSILSKSYYLGMFGVVTLLLLSSLFIALCYYAPKVYVYVIQ